MNRPQTFLQAAPAAMLYVTFVISGCAAPAAMLFVILAISG